MTRSLFRILTTLAIALFAIAPAALAGTTGKLTGKVTNDKKEPMPGVNVRIEGQRLGAISDDQGSYVIIGVPAGTVTVHANIMGSAAFTAENVTITADFTTELNIVLRTEAVQMQEVKVEAERPLLQKDATSTARYLSSEQLQRLPTRGYQEAAAQQSGVVDFQRQIDRESQNGPTLIIRGGRPNETAFYVDGFSQQDPLTGNSTTSINNNAIQEVVVLNGGFNAEYGRIMSGVVNVITKEGGTRYTGSVEGLTDNLSGTGKDFLNTRIYDYNVYDANLGGPILPGKDVGTFYASGQRRWQRDRLPTSNYGTVLPLNSLGGWTGQGKLSFPVAKSIDLKLGGLFSHDDWQQYLNSFRFDLPHTPRYQDENGSVTGQWVHRLSAKAFYDVGMTWFSTERKRGDGAFMDDLAQYGRYGQPNIRQDIPWFFPGFSGTQGDPLSDSLAAEALKLPGSTGYIWDDYLHRKSTYLALKGDYTSQVNAYHQLKGGVQFDAHTLRYYRNYFPTRFASGDVNDVDSYGFGPNGVDEKASGPLDDARKPRTASVFLQDKYERAGIVVNAGLRYDYINVNTKALKTPDDPLGADGVLTAADLTASKTYGRLSPRFGVGFPVTEKTVMHVNWGQFYQQPNLQDLYVSYKFLEYKVSTGSYYVPFGNPNLKPEQTTGYEVGVEHMLSDFSKLDVSVYYKDVKDLVQVENVPAHPYAFASFRNKDFATIKGLDIGFTLRRINHVSANMAYSLSFANGTGSVSNTQRNIAWTASEPPRQTSPLDFDQRHKLSVNVDCSFGKGEGPKLGNWTPLASFDVDVLYNVASGTPYTPTNVFDEVTQLNVASQPIGPINSRYGPWTQSFDFKATRSWNVSGLNLAAYVWVLNLFNMNNEVTVFTGTGTALTTGYFSTPDGQAIANDLTSKGIDPQRAFQLALQNQSLYGVPRAIRFGVKLGF